MNLFWMLRICYWIGCVLIMFIMATLIDDILVNHSVLLDVPLLAGYGFMLLRYTHNKGKLQL